MSDEERRKQPRNQIWIDATVQTPETSLSAIATEISGDGIRIQSQKIIPHDTEVQVALKRNVKIEFHGTVVWAVHTVAGTLNVYEIGIKNDLIVLENLKFNTPSARDQVVEEILSSIS
jgi:hypothetical protein